jgi:hypothetical protein
MRSEKTKTTSILLVLLIYVFIAGNTSGELTLCIGANWHIALEPLNHEHNENHPHIEHNGQVKSPHCKPCIDIPIFIGPTDNRFPVKQVKPNQGTLNCLLKTEVIAHDLLIVQAAPLWISSFADENRFLRSVILLV